MNIVTNIFAHWQEIVVVALAVLEAARQIVKLTPSKADDELVAKVTSILDEFGVKPAAK
jgi:hypothetical protein